MQETEKFEYLDQIQAPEDVRNLPASALPKLADELRKSFMQLMNQVGGHFGASLGTIELTIALHYVFNTPFHEGGRELSRSDNSRGGVENCAFMNN